MENNKLDELISRIYKILENNYNEETGFAGKYVITDIDLGLVSEYDNIEYNNYIIEDKLSEMTKELCGVELDMSLEFDEENKSIALETHNTLFIDNESEMISFLNSLTLVDAVIYNRAFCFPVTFTKEVNMNKACKWLKHKILQNLTPQKEKFVSEYVDFGAKAGLVKGIYLTNKGENALDSIYNEVLDEIDKGKTEIVIPLKGNAEAYNGLSREDMQNKLDNFFGGNFIELTAFDIRQTLEESEDHKIELVVMIEDILTKGSYIQLDVINEIYESVLLEKLKEDKFLEYILITDRMVEKNENMLDHLANKVANYLKEDIEKAAHVEWLNDGCDIDCGQYIILVLRNR